MRKVWFSIMLFMLLGLPLGNLPVSFNDGTQPYSTVDTVALNHPTESVQHSPGLKPITKHFNLSLETGYTPVLPIIKDEQPQLYESQKEFFTLQQPFIYAAQFQTNYL
ncbi:hypothetical protein CHN50_12270 [Priestia aryabhattai]|uniref:hypothetical protein n=1 Tax=Bacillus sp. CBEL-1 TaxID=2502980 RepID=UPI000B9FDE6A|nr:hypothetical protein [Bacillus sp. CBEL-1]OZT12166.1 hypothetical protein CHN50_12270 [Priestia aryabhattai]TDB50974.1 hypothetical protein EPL02_18260 [Bacillus sp. CBEL-1]